MGGRKHPQDYRSPQIQLCPSCGRERRSHPSGCASPCPVTPEMTEALKGYRRENGPSWKAKLARSWKHKQQLSPALDEAAKVIGHKAIVNVFFEPTRSRGAKP